MQTITLDDMTRQVTEATSGSVGTYDVESIVDQLHTLYGLCDVDDIPDHVFWNIVLNHTTD